MSPFFQMRQALDDDGSLRLTLVGEFDIASIERVQSRVRQLGSARAPMRIDVSQLTFIDAAGLRTLLDSLDYARREGWELELGSEMVPALRRIVNLIGLGPALWPAAA